MQGEILFEFENDKSVMEFECPANGTLARVLVTEGQTVACGTVVARLETVSPMPAGSIAAESGPNLQSKQSSERQDQASVTPLPGSSGQSPGQESTQPVVATPAAKRLARELSIDLSTISGRGPQGRIQLADIEAAAQPQKPVAGPRMVTPVAERMAVEMGVDWTRLAGSSPGGRVVKEDIRQAIQPSPPITTATPGRPAGDQPLSGARRIIARRMSESAFSAPHVTLHAEVNASALVEARSQLNAELAGAAKISYNALLIAIIARALQDHPQINSCLVDEKIHRYPEINVALAVDTERGLLVPVIRRADRLDVLAIQQTGNTLIERAVSGKSLPDDLSGGTFTLTNLGMFEIDGFTPIINQPQAAILGAGRIAPKPAVVDSEVVVCQMMTLSLSFDHRIVDGGPAARFLQRIKQLIERPFALILPSLTKF